MITLTTSENHPVSFKQWEFPGGERGVKLQVAYRPNYIRIDARIESSDDLIDVGLIRAACFDMGVPCVDLFMPYLPYARQDRVCNHGESNSLAWFADYIKSLQFDKITLVDPHSDVALSLFRGAEVIDQLEVVRTFPELHKFVMETDCVFCAPDSGSNKKVQKITDYFGHREYLKCDKVRDPETGAIARMDVPNTPSIYEKTVIIFDDICDGGATFMILTKALKAKGREALRVVLYVTHGLFTAGTDRLFDAGIDRIYTTNSRNPETNDDKRIIVKKL